jgi:hypothetical protein
LSSKTHRTRMSRRRFKSDSSCGQDSATLDCRTFLSSRILQLAWRLVCPRRQGSRATWPASAWPRSFKVTETTSHEVRSLSRVVEYLFLDVVNADDEFPLLAGDPAFRPRRPRGRRRLRYGGRADWSQPQPSPHRGRTRGATDASAPNC